jgi:hypothetical protein
MTLRLGKPLFRILKKFFDGTSAEGAVVECRQ